MLYEFYFYVRIKIPTIILILQQSKLRCKIFSKIAFIKIAFNR